MLQVYYSGYIFLKSAVTFGLQERIFMGWYDKIQKGKNPIARQQKFFHTTMVYGPIC